MSLEACFNKGNLIGVSLLMLAVANLPAVGSINDGIDARVDVNGVRIYPFAADQAARPDIPPVIINDDIRNHVEDAFDILSRMSQNVEKIQQSDFGKLPTVAPKLQDIKASTLNIQKISKRRKIPPDRSRVKIAADKIRIVEARVRAKNVGSLGAAERTQLTQSIEEVRLDMKAMEKGT